MLTQQRSTYSRNFYQGTQLIHQALGRMGPVVAMPLLLSTIASITSASVATICLTLQPQQSQQQRPRSGKVRPLSGRVFMRRTVERGWVAKAYPDAHASSQLDLDLYDDLSDVESLDSFFDDDFDTEQQEEKIQNLLSCNTLGVESKVVLIDTC